MPRAVIYARLSDVRKGDVEGIERQIREAEAHAARLGVEVVERLVDNDISAASRKQKRPAFQRLLEGMAADEWDVVVLRSLDRWVRRPRELEDIIDVVERCKATVESVNGGRIDLRSRQGRMLARMMTAVAADEVEATRERVTDWHADRAARGLPQSGAAGYGFNADKLTVNPVEAAAIREAAGRVLAGEALLAIARDFNERKVPASGPTWRASTIRRVLVAPRTAGLRVHRGQIVGDAQWPPILDRVTFQRLVNFLNRPERLTPGSRGSKLLTGLASCGKCDNTLNHKTMRGVRRYYCRHCFGTMVAAERLEEHVAADLLTAVDSPRLSDVLTVPDDTGTVVDRITALEADLEAVAAEVGDGSLSVTEWKVARTGIVERLEALRGELARRLSVDTRAEWGGRGTQLQTVWPSMTVTQQRRVLNGWVADVKVNPAVVGVNRFDGRRVSITWRD